MSRFSIVIPIYNAQQYLKDCLDSLLAQSYADWEAICVNDGSSDSSEAILREYAASDHRFRIVQQENSGVSSARNAGIRMASSPWLLFLDADDVLHCDACLLINKAIAEHPKVDIVAFGTVRFLDCEHIDWDIESSSPSFTVYDTRFVIPEMEMVHYFAGKAYRKTVVESKTFGPFTHGEDVLFLIQCMKSADSVALTGAKLYAYRIRSDSATQSEMTLKRLKGHIALCKEYFSELEAFPKSVNSCFFRGRVFFLIFHCGIAVSYFSRDEIDEGRVAWKDMMAFISSCSVIQLRYRCIARFVSMVCPSFFFKIVGRLYRWRRLSI